jgi:hypothetical protein
MPSIVLGIQLFNNIQIRKITLNNLMFFSQLSTSNEKPSVPNQILDAQLFFIQTICLQEIYDCISTR